MNIQIFLKDLITEYEKYPIIDYEVLHAGAQAVEQRLDDMVTE